MATAATSCNMIETTSRLVLWTIDVPDYRVSTNFSMGKWHWHLSTAQSQWNSLTLGLCIKLMKGDHQPQRLPIASCIIRIYCSKRYPNIHVHQEIKEHDFRTVNDISWLVDGWFVRGRKRITIEFLDLKIAPENGGVPYSIWAEYAELKDPLNASVGGTLGKMLSQSIHMDMTLNASDGSIGAHRAVLAASSPVFRKMFSNTYKEAVSSTINISDMTVVACKAMLDYFYGNLTSKEFRDHRMELLLAAHKYDIVDLKKMCDDSLVEDIDTKNVFDRLQIAFMYQLTELKFGCLRHLVKFRMIFEVKEHLNSYMEIFDKELTLEMMHAIIDEWKAS